LPPHRSFGGACETRDGDKSDAQGLREVQKIPVFQAYFIRCCSK